MSDTYLVENGVLVSPVVDADGTDYRVIERGGLVWRDDRIAAVGVASDLRSEFPDAVALDARGGVIFPGLINLHHHFYSALARGLNPGVPMTSFPEVLDRLWWRLDRALDPDTVRLSAELALADCVRWGCTTVFDHHASPSCIGGSLDVIAAAVRDAGISAALCYEVTDRNGPEAALAGVAENLRFIESVRHDGRLRGLIGLHASFTVKDDTLARVADIRPERTGCHVHVAEDPVDDAASEAQFGLGAVSRLDRHGLLDSRALIAHGIHLSDADYELVAQREAVIVHNPESNANNGVGRLDVSRAAEHGCLIGLGTDGMAAAVLRALRLAFLMERHESRDPSTGFGVCAELLGSNIRVARRVFNEPFLGELTPGAPADVIVLDAAPPTPLDSTNAYAHLVFGAAEAPVRHTVARGKTVLRDFEFTEIDGPALAARGRAAAPAVWQRFHGLAWGTSFLGS